MGSTLILASKKGRKVMYKIVSLNVTVVNQINSKHLTNVLEDFRKMLDDGYVIVNSTPDGVGNIVYILYKKS